MWNVLQNRIEQEDENKVSRETYRLSTQKLQPIISICAREMAHGKKRPGLIGFALNAI